MGQAPRSQYASPALSLLIAAPLTGAIFGFGGSWRRGFEFVVVTCASAGRALDGPVLARCASGFLHSAQLGSVLALASTAVLAAATGAAALQGSLTWAPASIGVRQLGLIPAQHLKRVFNSASIGSTVFSALILGLLATWTFPSFFRGLAAIARASDLAAQVAELASIMHVMWVRALSVLVVFAGVDIAINRRRFARSLRMTVRELKEERAQTEARPEAKQRRKTIGLRRSRSLRLDAIRAATAVVTNPTHVAVALRYAPPEIEVPIVVARGADLTAAIVRRAADEARVPIIESAELARLLYAKVDVDEPIPEECYAAVAAVFAWIVRTQGSLRGAAREDE